MTRVLLDSHILIWWRAEPERLSDVARNTMSDPGSELYWSAASTWELAIKVSQGKLSLPEPIDHYVARAIAEDGLLPLEVTHQHAAGVFDRLLVCQALQLGLTLLSADACLRLYPVTTLW